MLITARELLAYRTRDGRTPFNEWLDELDDQDIVARILARLARVRQGNLGDSRSVGEGVFELRIDHGPGYRIYFAQKGRTLVILLWGGDKRSQEKDIPRAKQCWHDYKQRE